MNNYRAKRVAAQYQLKHPGALAEAKKERR